MNDTIVYLMGAGASYQRVPVVEKLTNEMMAFVKQLEHYDATKEVFSTATELVEAVGQHATIDTYAKKLFLQKKTPELSFLKHFLAIFLIYIQSTKTSYREKEQNDTSVSAPLDTRYDSFLASVLDYDPTNPLNTEPPVPTIPSNQKCISWNYDFQLEKAYYGFVTNDNYVGGHIRNRNQFIKPNGTCLYNETQINHEYFKRTLGRDDFSINEAIEMFKDLASVESQIHFAWESDVNDITTSIAKFSASKVMVIIGYSFPYFNKAIDQAIFASLPNLQKIYVQVLKKDFPGVKKRLESITPGLEGNVDIELIEDLETFYIPDEFVPRFT